VRRVGRASRRTLQKAVDRSPKMRRFVELAHYELARTLDDDTYDAEYFGEGRNPFDRMGLSGYERYSRQSSNADIAAYVVWRFFDVHRTLDIGCATGFVVEALRELGIDAEGNDVSRWAVTHASPGARGHVRQGNLLGKLPYKKRQFDLVTALETLEHLPPAAIPKAIRELARVTNGWVVATIPSFGHNDHGPHGFPHSKVRDERLEHYLALGDSYHGPVPYEDLYRDARGEPIEGHLTIASFAWWTARFAEAGLERCGAVEERVHPVLARFNLSEFWNFYVFAKRGVGRGEPFTRPAEELLARERLWGLDTRTPTPRALDFLRAGLGDSAVEAALRSPPG
jgi:SAM-dependent methyltransferase